MENINFILNGEKVSVKCHATKRLLDVLRDDLNLTGIKEGCGEGECGACSALIDNELVNTCLTAILTVKNKELTTIEGFRNTERFKLLESAFAEAGAVQCGFCTPGMILAAEAMLRKNSDPTEEQIRRGVSGNLCRCTGYNMIIEAIKIAAKRGNGLW